MIGFGELRRLSTQWQTDIATVERAYAVDWLLKGLYDQSQFANTLVLRGSAALRYARSGDYPLVEEPDFLSLPLEEAARRPALQDALTGAGQASGMKFALTDDRPGSLRIEYVGPLGRRSAAQPHIVLSVVPGQTRLPAEHVPLIHPFSDKCETFVSAIALEEFVAERIAGLGSPRARDVFDLWFALIRVRGRVDLQRARELALQISREQGAQSRPAGLFDPNQRQALDRAWDKALRRIPAHPSFSQVERELEDAQVTNLRTNASQEGF